MAGVAVVNPPEADRAGGGRQPVGAASRRKDLTEVLDHCEAVCHPPRHQVSQAD